MWYRKFLPFAKQQKSGFLTVFLYGGNAEAPQIHNFHRMLGIWAGAVSAARNLEKVKY